MSVHACMHTCTHMRLCILSYLGVVTSGGSGKLRGSVVRGWLRKLHVRDEWVHVGATEDVLYASSNSKVYIPVVREGEAPFPDPYSPSAEDPNSPVILVIGNR